MDLKKNLHGFIPAVVTPFDEKGHLQEENFEHLVSWLMGLGANGICVAGDNGESWALQKGERTTLTKLAKKVTKGKIPVFTGCSAPTFLQVLEYLKEAEAGEADGVLMMPPTYVLKGSFHEIDQRFQKITENSNLPIILYNSPRRVGYSLSIKDITVLADKYPFLGIKESHRDFFHHTHLYQNLKNKISILVGPCHYILPGITLGASGFIATGPELLGADVAKLYDLAKSDAGSKKYQEIHYKLTLIYEALMSTGTWPSAFKETLNLLGLPAGVPRDPVLPLDEKQKNQLRKTFEELAII